jgi:CMP-N,N'-diacetyllegionaminic acid synthase
VPARGGSKRAPGKNLAVLGGRTLVRRALETAVESRACADLVLSSDDPAILDEAAGLDVVALRRPEALASDRALAYDVAMHALEAMEARTGAAYDALALVQATTPFTRPGDVAGAVALLARPGVNSVVTVTRIEDGLHPLKLKRMEGSRLIPFLRDDELTPSHDLPELWSRNGAVYASRRAVLADGTLVSADAHGLVMPRARSVDINDPLDLAFAEFLLARGGLDA